MKTKDALSTLVTQIVRVFRALCQELEAETYIYIYIFLTMSQIVFLLFFVSRNNDQ